MNEHVKYIQIYIQMKFHKMIKDAVYLVAKNEVNTYQLTKKTLIN
jgi:hypothetical protein